MQKDNEIQKYISPADLFKMVQQRDETDIAVAEEQAIALVNETYSELQLTEKQVKAFTARMGPLKHGFQAMIPLICRAKGCPFYEVCQLKLAGVEPPAGKPCLIELPLFSYYRQGYAESFNIKPAEVGAWILINEMAEMDIYDMRATMVLSMGNPDDKKDMTQALLQSVDHYNDEGKKTHTSHEVHQAFGLKERVKNRKLKILELLVATRKESYKKEAALRVKNQGTAAERTKTLIAKAEAAERAILDEVRGTNQYKQDIIDVEIVEED